MTNLDLADPFSFVPLPAAALMPAASARRDAATGRTIGYSRKVFIPLTQLCRDVCHYCTFAKTPSRLAAPYLSLEEVLAIARAGAEAGCKEALFTLGDRPEARWPVAAAWLAEHGYSTTLDYVEAAAATVLAETGLMPHINPGLMSGEEMARLRRVSVSMGLMLETSSARLSKPGGPHYGSPDKDPARRLAVLEESGRQKIPMTSGILVGIGETRAERIESLVALADLHRRHGHLQEVIVQNFRPKAGTKMATSEALDEEEHLWSIAAARLILPDDVPVQAPPNLRPDALERLLEAGVADWGGISPVTPDHVNPEAPWPAVEALGARIGAAGYVLAERLALHPRYAAAPGEWVDAPLAAKVRAASDGEGFARPDTWLTGRPGPLPPRAPGLGGRTAALSRALADADAERVLSDEAITTLLTARGAAFDDVIAAADAARARQVGDLVTYVLNRNINYTNICQYRCAFCAFSKGVRRGENDPAYDLDLAEIGARTAEAWARGAGEVCLQGGIHPRYTGDTYVSIVRAVKDAAPGIHVHAFSPLEVTHGAQTLGLSLEAFLSRLAAEGLASLPGTAAEILSDDVRAVICPDKITTAEWFDVMRAAHRIGLRSTATIMFGHVEAPHHLARHLAGVRDHQIAMGEEGHTGFSEFVPLPFVAHEAPIFLKGRARSGPTFREAVLMHAVARLVLGPVIPNIQTSWVKMGPDGARVCLEAGANDLGGILMNESITRAAGASFGQEMSPDALEAIARAIGRRPEQRNTLYQPIAGAHVARVAPPAPAFHPA